MLDSYAYTHTRTNETHSLVPLQESLQDLIPTLTA